MSGVIVGYSIYQNEEARSDQKKANREAKAANEKMLAQAERQLNQEAQQANRINRRYAESSGVLDATAQRARSGAAGTMLTGPQGVDLSALQLGRNTLLGQ